MKEKTITQQKSPELGGTGQRQDGVGGMCAAALSGSDTGASQRTDGPVAHLKLGCHPISWEALFLGKGRHLGSRRI